MAATDPYTCACGHDIGMHAASGRCRWLPSDLNISGRCTCMRYEALKPLPEPQESPGTNEEHLVDLLGGLGDWAVKAVLVGARAEGIRIIDSVFAGRPPTVDKPVEEYDWITDPDLSPEAKRAIFEDLIAVQVEEPPIASQRELDLLRTIEKMVAQAYPYKVLRERLEALKHEASDKIEHVDGAMARTRLNGMMQAYAHAVDLLDSLVPEED